jgi:DNA polymerase III gamma/tau subunit
MVEDIQQICNQKLPPDATRVVILDEAHSLSAKAWGAFLKTIEEPPPRNVFIFVTTERDKVLETVRSRSSLFVFRPVTEVVIAQTLRAIPLDQPFEPAVYDFIASVANGSMRDALHLLDKVLLLGSHVTLADAERLLGVDSETTRDLADALLSMDFKYYVETLDIVLGRGFMPDEIADVILRIARDLMVLRTGWRGQTMSRLPAEKLLENAEHLAPTVHLGTAVIRDQIDRVGALYGCAVQLIESRNINRIALETMFIRWLEKC